jgi:hypothetical protein
MRSNQRRKAARLNQHSCDKGLSINFLMRKRGLVKYYFACRKQFGHDPFNFPKLKQVFRMGFFYSVVRNQ